MFAFFIHPRDTSDEINYHDVERIKRIYGILPFDLWIPIGWLTRLLGLLPNRLGNKVLPFSPALVTGKIYSYKDKVGWIVTIPMTARQMLDMANGSPKQKASLDKKVVQAVQISRKVGARIVGLGAMTAPITAGGSTLAKRVEGVGVTNGNALTAVINIRGLKTMASKTGIDLASAKIAVVGATGSVGKASTLLLAESLERGKLLLISLSLGKLRKLKKTIEEQNPNVSVDVSDKIDTLKDCDMILVATSHPDTIIRKEHLKEGVVIYDDTQPRNVSREIADDPNFLVIDGSIVRIPYLQNTMDIGLPMNIDMYACEAETWLLSEEKKFEDFALGRDIIEQAKQISPIAEKHNINLSPFMSFGRELTERDFERIRKLRL